MSKKLLHLDSSILGASSASRMLSAHAVDQLRAKVPGLEVIYRDLAADPIPHLSGAYVAVTRGGSNVPISPALGEDLALGETVLQEFISADIVVIGVAFYNFSIATQLKAWIDRIAVAGKTFRYNASGKPEGLAGNSKSSWPSRAVASMAKAPLRASWNMRRRTCAVRSASLASPPLTSSPPKDSA